MMNELQFQRRAKRFWISLVVMLLALQLVIGSIAISLATGDPSAATVPDYHRAALQWDTDKQQRSLIRRLGWQFSVEASDVVDARGMRAIRVGVTDHADAGVSDLTLSAKVFHHARAREAFDLQFVAVGDGTYQAIGPMSRAGLWSLDFQFRGGGELGRHEYTTELD